MSVVFEQIKPPRQVDITEELNRIRSLGDPHEQFATLSHDYPHDFSRLQKQLPGKDIEALIDFAADSGSSHSLLVRSQAFELAVESLLTDDQPDDEAKVLQSELHELLPNGLKDDIDHMKIPLPEGGRMEYRKGYLGIGKYAAVATVLCARDGIDVDFIFPNWVDYGDGEFATMYPDSIPSMALALLASLKNQVEGYDGSNLLPLSPFVKLLPLAIDIQKTVENDPSLRLVDIPNPETVKKDAGEIAQFLDLGDERQAEYIDQLLELKSASKLLRDIFPEKYSVEIEKGAQKLFAEVLYAVRSHIHNGNRTQAGIPLNGDTNNTLSLILGDSEPLELLKHLSGSIKHLHEVATGENAGVTQVNMNGNFKLYRFWQPGQNRSTVSVYIRPEGDISFDPKLEYGREEEGVEASISFVVDSLVRPGQVIEVGRHRRKSSDDRISIRLDREGIDLSRPESRRDPTREQGVLSLDIGSIIGDEEWLSTKIGRFLAWGNVLRSRAVGDTANLNHSRTYFDEEHGKALTFASEAHRLIEYFQQRKLTKKEVVAHLSGLAATRSLKQPK